MVDACWAIPGSVEVVLHVGTSTFNYIEAEVVKEQLEIQLKIRGTQGLGWEGETFSEEEIRMGRLWLEAKAISIAGGSNEVQLNIIAKRVLGLPD